MPSLKRNLYKLYLLFIRLRVYSSFPNSFLRPIYYTVLLNFIWTFFGGSTIASFTNFSAELNFVRLFFLLLFLLFLISYIIRIRCLLSHRNTSVYVNYVRTYFKISFFFITSETESNITSKTVLGIYQSAVPWKSSSVKNSNANYNYLWKFVDVLQRAYSILFG